MKKTVYRPSSFAASVASIDSSIARSSGQPYARSMMCPEDGISTTTPSTPHSLALWMSSTMQRANAKISGPRPASTIDFTAASSWGETIGIPASIRSTPAAASRLAIASLSSAVNATPACCSPSRSVTSWNRTRDGNSSPARDSSRWFQGLVKKRPSASHGVSAVIRASSFEASLKCSLWR